MLCLHGSDPHVVGPPVRYHVECITCRVVLAAWGRMEAGGEFTAMGM
jgi:hypothetical protein